MAADSIVDAISFIRRIVLLSQNKFFPNPDPSPAPAGFEIVKSCTTIPEKQPV